MNWPLWWMWDLELTPHLEKRMEQRNFTEIDLRDMMDQASGYHRDLNHDRWVVETRHQGRNWEIIVEPDPDERMLVVITAYSTEGL